MQIKLLTERNLKKFQETLGLCIANCTKLLLRCKTETKIYRIFTNLQEEEEEEEETV